MSIGKIFGFGSTRLRFDSQKYNPIFGQDNNSSTNSLPMLKYAIPQPQNDTFVAAKYAIPPKPQEDYSNIDEHPVLKSAIPNPNNNTNEPPVLKCAIPKK